MASLDICADTLDGLNLVVAFFATRNRLVNLQRRRSLGIASSIENLLQIILRENCAYLSRRALLLINKPGLKSV